MLFQAGILVGVIPIEIDRDRDLRHEVRDGAIALVDFGHDPIAGADRGGRDRVVSEEAAEHMAGGKAGGPQGGHQHARSSSSSPWEPHTATSTAGSA